MVVCKFFQQGYCRYAQNCRFEHVYGSKYTYNANQQLQSNVQQTGVTDEQLLNQVHTDINAVLKGGQWLLSCYAPFKEKPAIPGLNDLSPEEARLFIYESKANNTVDQAMAFMNNLFLEARSKYEQLLQNSPQVTKVLRTLYKGETTVSPFSNNQNAFGNSSTNNNAASSIFRSAVQNTSPFGQNVGSGSIFSQNPLTSPDNLIAKSIFAQASQNVFGSGQVSAQFGSAQTQNVFGTNQPSNNGVFTSNQNSGNFFGSPPSDNAAAKSIFAQAAQNTFGSSQPMDNSSNIFANASPQLFGTSQKSNQTPFVQNQNNSPIAQTQNSSPFANASNNSSPFSNTNNNIFQTANTATNIFAANMTISINQTTVEGIYSKLEELSKSDIEAFESVEFKLGFIPEIAPPAELCAKV